MSTITITIQNDAQGEVTLDGSARTVTGATIEDTRRQALDHAIAYVRERAEGATVVATDPSGTYHLAIDPSGQVTTAPTPPVTAPESQAVIETPAPAPDDVPVVRDASSTLEVPGSVEQLQKPVEMPDITPATPAMPAPDPLEADSRWKQIAARPAEHGFRATLNGVGLKLGPSPAELAERREAYVVTLTSEQRAREEAQRASEEQAQQESRRAARERVEAQRIREQRALIQTNFDDSKTVMVANEKGGVGKTTDIYCIGATFGRIRGGDVIAWDANETRGTLGFRAQKDHHSRSVVDLLEEAAAEFGTVEGSRRSTVMRYTRSQGDNQFHIIASDESRDRQDLVDGDGFRTVHEILGRFHSLVLIDTGNNHRVSHFKAALAATDQLVIPVSAGADGAYAAEVMMDTFIGFGYGELVRNAVVLLHDSATRRGDASDIASKFENRVRAVLPIPFDPALDTGGEIDFDALQPATRAAYQDATAAIAAGLARPVAVTATA